MGSFKENLGTALIVFTFGIPVIPVGGYLLYDLYFGDKADASSVTSSQNSTASTPTTTYETEYSSEDDDPLRGGGSTSTSARTYSSYSCTSDCSGHDAGYQWGEDHDICDTDYDNGNSASFNEGVRAYAEDNCSGDDEYTDDNYDYYP